MTLPEPLALDIETGWEPPSRRAKRWFWFSVVGDMISALDGHPTTTDPAVGIPKWRVVLYDDQALLATSYWSRDFPEVERLQETLQSRYYSMTADQIRQQVRQQISLN